MPYEADDPRSNPAGDPEQQRRLEATYDAEMAWKELLASAPNLQWQNLQAQTVSPFDPRLAAGSYWQNPLNPSAYSSPEDQAAMREALKTLQTQARGGYTAADYAMQGEGLRQIAAQSQAGRESAVQAMQMRGLSGGGMELAARLAAEQNQANATGSFMAQQQAMAQQRALQALQQSYGLRYGQQRDAVTDAQQRASALDAFNAQNVGWQRQQAQANAQTQNDMSRYNAEQQRAMAQQQFQNRATGTQGLSNVYTGASQQAQQQSQFDEQQQLQQQQMAADAMTGITGMI